MNQSKSMQKNETIKRIDLYDSIRFPNKPDNSWDDTPDNSSDDTPDNSSDSTVSNNSDNTTRQEALFSLTALEEGVRIPGAPNKELIPNTARSWNNNKTSNNDTSQREKSITLSPEQFEKVPFDWSAHRKSYVKELEEALRLEHRADTIRMYSNDEFDLLPDWIDYKHGYSVCLGLDALQDKKIYPYFVSGVVFKKQHHIDQEYVDRHHDFFKRGSETPEETCARLEEFFDAWWSTYVVEDPAGASIGSINVEITWKSMAVFSFMVDPAWRSKWVANMMINNVIIDAVDQGVEYVFAKTKNKFVYYLFKRRLWGELLRKEIYR